MAARILPFLRRKATTCDWSPEELAEFYRVEAALIRVGLHVVPARGLTDENDPWFVFCSADDDEVIIHFARIGRRYLISSPTLCGTAMGYDFRRLVQSTIERHPAMQLPSREGNLFLHPAALLVVLVASAFLKTGHGAEAAPAKPTTADTNDGKLRYVVPASAADPAGTGTLKQEPLHDTLILAAIAATIAATAQAEPVTIVVTASAHLADFVEQSPEQPIRSGLQDGLDAAAAHGSGGAAPTVVPSQSIVVPQLEALPSTLAHASPLDVVPSLATAGTAGSFASTASMSVALPIPAQADLHPTVPDPVSGAQFVPLAALPDISKADIDLLHGLHVPNDVLYIPTLPDALSTVLEAGAHTVPVHLSDAHIPSTGVTTLPAAADVHAAQGSVGTSPSVTAPDTTTGVTSNVAATTAPAESVASATTTTASSATAAVPDMSAVLAAVQQFQSIEVQPVFVMTDHAAIFYDASAAGSHFGALKSITYNFDDGFSISLVGLPTELAHVSLHV